MDPQRTDYLVGNLDPNALAATYRCGHCTSETSTYTDGSGIAHVAIHHDDGCPVLTGVISSAPDVVRAVAGHVPATFRP